MPGKRAYLSLCALYRDQAPYLREWIEFHRLVGVERFYLYDNFSADGHRAVLAPYVEDGTVVLTDWPHPYKDEEAGEARGDAKAFNHCLEEHGENSRWFALLDVDDFLFSPTYRS